MAEISVCSPTLASTVDVDAFLRLVLSGEEVDPVGLRGRVLSASTLAFARANSKIVGVAAIKNPGKPYKNTVFRSANCIAAQQNYRLEFGWVFVDPDYRRKGISKQLTAALIEVADSASIFATSLANNDAMHRTLEGYGFQKTGKPWRSRLKQKENLVLFLREGA
jgi:GNAT superfamily N-acetyltransferase